MKVAILIPNSKESLRCPNKNRILRKYTLQWIEKELTSLNDSCKVDVYEIRDKKVPVDTFDDFSYSYTINPIFVSDVNEMKDLLKITDEKIIADVFVLLQLTQPARRAGALKEVLNSVQSHPNQLITSYSVVEFESWRIINDCNWNEYTRHTRKGNQLNVYDGAWYCWQSKEGSQIVFNKDNKKRFIKNIDKLIDVDTPEQLRKRFTIPSQVKHTRNTIANVFAIDSEGSAIRTRLCKLNKFVEVRLAETHGRYKPVKHTRNNLQAFPQAFLWILQICSSDSAIKKVDSVNYRPFILRQIIKMIFTFQNCRQLA